MVRADPGVLREHAGDVRHDQADEDDRPDDGDGAAGEQGDGQHALDPDHADPEPERPGDVVAEREAVEGGRAGQGEYGADPEERQDAQQDFLALVGQRARRPEPVAVQGVRVGQCDGTGQREQQRGDRDTGQRQLHRGRARTSESAQQIDQHAGGHRPGEREPDEAVHRADAEDPDGHHDGEGGARAHAEDAGVGQRIAGQRLHQRAREAERGAGGETEGGTGQSYRPDHVVDTGVGRIAEEGVPDLVEGDAERAVRHRQAAQDQQCRAREREQEYRAGAFCRPDRRGPQRHFLRSALP